MQRILDEIEQIAADVEINIKSLKKTDTSSKKAAANRDRSIEGRNKIKQQTEQVEQLQQKMNAMTTESTSEWPIKKFDKSKKDALKTLSNLLNRLNRIDEHLAKVTGPLPSTKSTESQPETSTNVDENLSDRSTSNVDSRDSVNRNFAEASTLIVNRKITSSKSKSSEKAISSEDEDQTNDVKKKMPGRIY